MACVEADVPIPDEVLRVDAKVTVARPGVWLDSDDEETSEEFEGFEAAECEVGNGPGQEPEMTCGVNLAIQTFSCLTPEEEVSALLGEPSIPPVTPPPVGTCPGGGVYVNEELCVR